MISKCRQGAAGNKIFSCGSPQIKVLGEGNELTFGFHFTLATEGTATKIDGFILSVNTILRANVCTLLDDNRITGRIDHGKPPEPVVKFNRFFRIIRGFTTLFHSIFEYF